MTEYDYICAQNYVEQIYNARLASHIDANTPIHTLVRWGCDWPKRVFGQLKPWSLTREGCPVWTRRHDVFCELVNAGTIKLHTR